MAWRRLLLVMICCGIAANALGPAGSAQANPTETCTPIQAKQALCPASGKVHRGHVDLLTHRTRGGGSGGIGRGGTGGGWGSNTADQPSGPLAICSQQKFRLPCNPRSSGTGAVTISDIAHFKPRPGTDHMQPNGWMVVGLETNFYATVPSELEQGELLGQPARVRFFPVAWHWTYGDGAQATVRSPGGTWSAQGLRDFDPTPTSHPYRAKGTYEIDLDIRFGAEYQYAGSGWTPVAGTIDVPANRLRAVAGDAKTVLVNHDCLVNPNGPGC